jgi:curved DNA-binding protein CbpA
VNGDVRREWFEKDYYQVARRGQERHCGRDQEGVPQARTAVPPRRQPGNKDAEERFKEISAANDVLGDEDKRKQYDQVREMGLVRVRGRRRRRFPAGPAGSPVASRAVCGSRTWAISATCSVGCSAGRDDAAVSERRGAPISRRP